MFVLQCILLTIIGDALNGTEVRLPDSCDCAQLNDFRSIEINGPIRRQAV